VGRRRRRKRRRAAVTVGISYNLAIEIRQPALISPPPIPQS
jgi:hypothetical protein